MSRLSHLVNLEPPPESAKRKQVFSNPDLRRYKVHRTNAKKRGIEFKLTFDEWFTWWKETGHYQERGSRRGQYVMGRIGDKGAYELGNIECTLAEVNSQAPHKLPQGDFCKAVTDQSPTGRAAEIAKKLRVAVGANT